MILAARLLLFLHKNDSWFYFITKYELLLPYSFTSGKLNKVYLINLDSICAKEIYFRRSPVSENYIIRHFYEVKSVMSAMNCSVKATVGIK